MENVSTVNDHLKCPHVYVCEEGFQSCVHCGYTNFEVDSSNNDFYDSKHCSRGSIKYSAKTNFQKILDQLMDYEHQLPSGLVYRILIENNQQRMMDRYKLRKILYRLEPKRALVFESACYYQLTGRYFKINPTLQQLIVNDFEKIFNGFYEVNNSSTRSSFLNIQFVIKKLFEKHKIDCIDNDFILFVTEKSRIVNETIYNNIVSLIDLKNWVVI